MFKKITSLLATMLIFITCVSYANYSFKSGVLFDLDSGRIMYEYKKEEVLPIASLTKLMTYYTFRDFIEQKKISTDTIIHVDENFDELGDDASVVGLKKGNNVSIEQLIDTLFVASANDSATQLKRFYEKNNNSIIDAMNQKSKEIGMINTKYVNVTGLTDKNGYNVSSCKDLMVLVSSLLKKYPDVLKITGKRTVLFNGKIYNSTNGILKFLPNADGLKTGYTKNAGFSLIGTEIINKENSNTESFRIVSIILGCPTENARVKESIDLLDFAKKNYTNYKVIDEEKKYRKDNEFFKLGYIEGHSDKNVFLLKENSEKIDEKITFNAKNPWNIKKNDKIGKIEIKNARTGETKLCDLLADSNYKGVGIFKRVFLIIKNWLKK